MVYGMVPQDPELIHRGESTAYNMKMDFQYKFANLPVWYEPKGEKRDQMMKVLWDEHLPVYL